MASTVILLQNATVGGVDRDPITYHSLTPLPIFETLPIYAISNDTNVVDDACNELPDTTPDLSSYLVVVRRGSCSHVGFHIRLDFCVTFSPTIQADKIGQHRSQRREICVRLRVGSMSLSFHM